MIVENKGEKTRVGPGDTKKCLVVDMSCKRFKWI